MNKIKIFLSSRVHSVISKLEGGFTLSDLRGRIRDALQAEHFLEEQVLDVVVNEDNFHSTMLLDAFNNCMQVMRGCNLVVILYNGEAGWGIAGNVSANGICHEEFLLAQAEFSDMSYVLDISAYFALPANGDAFDRNELFRQDVMAAFPQMESVVAGNFEELSEKVTVQCKQYVLDAMGRSFATQKRVVAGMSVFGATLDWSKLTYAERKAGLEEQLALVFGGLEGLEQVYKQFHGVPDNMGVGEARNLVGRPFLYEHTEILQTGLAAGVVHFLGIYGTVTQTQAKNLVGYPDMAVIGTPFGFYLWEKHVHIQIFFLKSCRNPQTVKTRFSEVTNWLNASGERNRVAARAAARYTILKAINGVADII